MKRKDVKILKLNRGDKVWVKLPMNAVIIKKTKFGYILQTEASLQTKWQYYDDIEVTKI